MHRLVIGLMAVLAALLPVTSARAQVAAESVVVAAVRTLRAAQQDMLTSDQTAPRRMTDALQSLGRTLSELPAAEMNRPANRRAAFLLALNGGGQGPVARLVTAGGLEGVDAAIAKALLAIGEQNFPAALELLRKLERGRIDAAIAPDLALVRGVLAYRENEAGGMELLDEARLLAPGTFIEEAALRRQILALRDPDASEAIETKCRQYFTRFGASNYAEHLRQEIVERLATGRLRFSHANAVLDHLTHDLAVEAVAGLHLRLARRAFESSGYDIARLAAGRVAAVGAVQGPPRARARLYELAAGLTQGDLGQKSRELAALEQIAFDAFDRELLGAALDLAAAAGSDRKRAEVGKLDDADVPVQARAAAKAIAAADVILHDNGRFAP